MVIAVLCGQFIRMSVTFVARFFCSTRYYFVLLGVAFCSIPFLFVRFIVVNEIIA